ncbi:MAG: hypothetical protein AB7K09_06825 [Planctomycetota bacterium]
MTLVDLILPILAAAGATWFCSALAWMALPHHRKDYIALPADLEAKMVAMLKESGLKPGQYMFPDMFNREVMKDKAKMDLIMTGTWGMITLPGKPNMARNMLLTIVVFLITNVFVAYLGLQAGLNGSQTFMDRFQFVGTAGILAYTFAFLPNYIWFGQSTRSIWMNIVDGVIFGLVSGAVFAAMWPAVSAPM